MVKNIKQYHSVCCPGSKGLIQFNSYVFSESLPETVQNIQQIPKSIISITSVPIWVWYSLCAWLWGLCGSNWNSSRIKSQFPLSRSIFHYGTYHIYSVEAQKLASDKYVLFMTAEFYQQVCKIPSSYVEPRHVRDKNSWCLVFSDYTSSILMPKKL